jgi:hypothetical protein
MQYEGFRRRFQMHEYFCAGDKQRRFWGVILKLYLQKKVSFCADYQAIMRDGAKKNAAP